jgi:asparagine synthase (glutamine-hydrolysing)
MAGHVTLAGLIDPGRAFDESGARRMLVPALEPERTARIVAAGPLAAARSGVESVHHTPPSPVCLLAGTILNLDEICALVEKPVTDGAEPILAAGFRQFGAGLVERLSGAFVLLVWDPTEQRGVLAEDHLGVRSLYYSRSGSRLVFASDVRPLLSLLPTRPGPERAMIAHWLIDSSPSAEMTIHEGIRRLGAGHLLEIEGTRAERRQFWEPRYRRPARRTRSEAASELWTSVAAAVRARIGTGERAGIIMSGGIDSSTVAAASFEACGNGRSMPRAYSAVFPGRPELDESEAIDNLVDALGMESVQIEPAPQGAYAFMLDYLERWHLPLPGPGGLLERPLMERARADGIDVLLDGQGGDEVFGFSPYLVADRLRLGRFISSIRLTRQFPLMVERAPRNFSRRMLTMYGLKPALPLAFIDAARRYRRRQPRLLNEESTQAYLESYDPMSWRRGVSGPLWWAYKAHLLTRSREEIYLPEFLRHRAAMAGAEARPPLMDVPLVELVLGFPPELDFEATYDRPVIREALRGRVPDRVRLSTMKSNLSPYYYDTLAGADLAVARQLLEPSDAEIRAYVTPRAIDYALSAPPLDKGGMHWMWPVWGLSSIEAWLQFQKDPEFVERLRRSPRLVSFASRIRRDTTADGLIVAGRGAKS